LTRFLKHSILLYERNQKFFDSFRKSIKVDAKRSRPSLLDVAHHAGVSPATVSRVLNNTAPVRENVRARVLSSMTELGYAPNLRLNARTLENAIALLIQDILNPFLPKLRAVFKTKRTAPAFCPFCSIRWKILNARSNFCGCL